MLSKSFIAALVAALILFFCSTAMAQQKLNTDSFNDQQGPVDPLRPTGRTDSFNDTQTSPATPATIPGGPQGEVTTPTAQATASASATSSVTVPVAPPWETRPGIEQAARHYFESKQEYNTCRDRGDSGGMRRAEASMARYSAQLAAFKKQQAARDKAQDARLDVHSGLVWKHETQLNNEKDGLVPRVKKLEDDMNAVTPAIAGIDVKFDGLTWWVLVLTLVVLVGFSRRYWIHR